MVLSSSPSRSKISVYLFSQNCKYMYVELIGYPEQNFKHAETEYVSEVFPFVQGEGEGEKQLRKVNVGQGDLVNNSNAL